MTGGGIVMKKNGKSRLIFLIDLMIIILSLGIYYVHNVGWEHISYKPITTLGYIVLVWVLVSINSDVYRIGATSDIFKNLVALFTAFSILTACVIFFVAVFGNFKPDNKLVLYPLLYSVSIAMTFRLFFLIAIKHFTSNGYYKKNVLVIGGDRIVERVIYKIMSSPYLGYKLYGVIADQYHESLPKGIYLGKINRLCEIVSSKLVDEVIIALPQRREKELINIVNACESEGIRFRIVPDYYRMVKNRIMIETLDDIPLIAVQTEPLNVFGSRMQKRFFGIVISFTALTILSPIFILLAIIIKCTSRGPVFYSQKRVGANNEEFLIHKFRTMYVGPEKESNTTWTTADDDRVTTIGKFMRKTNIDELPQFWNVLEGDMSIVGPRPEREFFVEQFKDQIPDYKIRHLVKSGITGWAQINGFRGDTSISDRVKYDLHYLQNWSVWFDIKILILTIFSRKAFKNAY
jgi:Undecaprenyl-phosphate glucose phosphotransferase